MTIPDPVEEREPDYSYRNFGPWYYNLRTIELNQDGRCVVAELLPEFGGVHVLMQQLPGVNIQLVKRFPLREGNRKCWVPE